MLFNSEIKDFTTVITALLILFHAFEMVLEWLVPEADQVAPAVHASFWAEDTSAYDAYPTTVSLMGDHMS